MKLQLAPRVSRAPHFFRALAQGAGDDPRRAAPRWSLKAVSLLLPAKFAELSCPLTSAAGWERLWVEHLAAWASLLRLARRRASSDLYHAKAVMLLCPALAPHANPSSARPGVRHAMPISARGCVPFITCGCGLTA